MKLFSVVIMYVAVLLSSIISCRFLILFSSSKHKVRYYVTYVLISFLINYISLNTQLYIPTIVNQAIGILVAFGFSKLMLKNSTATALLTSVLNGVIFGIYNTFAFALSGILYRESAINGYVIMLLNSAIIIAFSAISLEVLCRRYSKQKTWSGKYSVLYICPMIFIYFITQTVIDIAYNPVIATGDRLQYGTSTLQDVEILFVVSIALISIYVILYFYEKIMGQIDLENKVSAMEIYTDIQKQYISEAQQKYDSTKAFRHDVHNHMLTLSGLVQGDEMEKAQEYLERFEDEYSKLAFEVYTGSPVIDIIIKEKFGFASRQGIRTICNVAIPENFQVDDFDLCVIFFNALDNAIKGCQGAGEKFIDVAARKNKDFFVIDIMNSFNPSGYEKGSGIGLETIRFITEKHGGYLDIGTEKDVFRLSIMFYLK